MPAVQNHFDINLGPFFQAAAERRPYLVIPGHDEVVSPKSILTIVVMDSDVQLHIKARASRAPE